MLTRHFTTSSSEKCLVLCLGLGRKAKARAAGAKLIADGTTTGEARKTLIYVNNRLEGNALETISAMVEGAEARR